MTDGSYDIDSEFDAATNRAAFVEQETFGCVRITGSDRLDLLHRMSTNDLLNGSPKRVVPTVLTTGKGRIIDLVRVVVNEIDLLALVSPGNEERFIKWLDKYCIMEDFHMDIVTTEYQCLTCVGPEAVTFCEGVLGGSLKRESVTPVSFNGRSLSIIHSSQFTTEKVDIVVARESEGMPVEYIRKQAAKQNIPRMGSEAFDAFRISRGIPVAGHELTESFNPYEVNLISAISFTKGCYIGQEVIARLDTYDKVQRRLVGVVVQDLQGEVGPPLILEMDGREVGTLTSVTRARVHNKRLGLGVVRKDAVAVRNMVQLRRGETHVGQAEVTELPIPVPIFSRNDPSGQGLP